MLLRVTRRIAVRSSCPSLSSLSSFSSSSLIAIASEQPPRHFSPFSSSCVLFSHSHAFSSLSSSSSSSPLLPHSSSSSFCGAWRQFSTTTTASPGTAEAAAASGAVVPSVDFEGNDEPWESNAIREVSHGRRRNVKASPRKMSEICRMVRGLSVEEALIQLQFSQKRNAKYLAYTIRSAATAGVNNFFMDRDRLVVAYANATKGKYGRFLRYRAKGKGEVNKIYFCHLRVGVKEEPYDPKEKKIGRYGRSIRNIAKTKQLIAEERARQRALEEFMQEDKSP